MRVMFGIVTKLQCLLRLRFEVQYLPNNKALQLTDNPLRGSSQAELGRFAS